MLEGCGHFLGVLSLSLFYFLYLSFSLSLLSLFFIISNKIEFVLWKYFLCTQQLHVYKSASTNHHSPLAVARVQLDILSSPQTFQLRVRVHVQRGSPILQVCDHSRLMLTWYSVAVQPGFQMNDDFFDNIEKYLEQSGEHDVDYDRESEDEGDDDDELAEDSEYRVGGQEDGLIAMEVPSTSAKSSVSIQRQQISAVLEPFSRHLDEHSRISFKSFLPEASALQAYQAPHSDPLMNPTTAKIFCHFVYVLGPSMSLFERIPPNPHIAFTPGFSAGLHGPQNIWSYTIPMLSLNHPPLLHAILALSALHISKLKNGPDHPSLLHYHIALRRLGKSIASDRHRSHVATLAATLMLAYYETMAAEHDKWSSHIHGAKLLIKDIDFDRIARRIETLDDSGEMEQQQQTPTGVSLLQQRRMRRHMIADDEVDDSFKQFLMGNKQRRQSVHKAKMKRDQLEGKYAKKEMETLRLQADLFWWYTKMDCYQSLLSGCPLV